MDLAPASVPEDEVKPIKTFNELKCYPWLKNRIGAICLKEPTPIQQYTLPAGLAGRNVLGCSPTGSGKTLCFAIPILQSLSADPFGGHSLVLTPTRELAFQIADQFRALGTQINIRVQIVVGGLDMSDQATALEKSPHIIIATPGRLEFLLKSGVILTFSLKRIKFLVLDEADRLLSVEFQESLSEILGHLPSIENRQTLLFSATMTQNLKRMGTMSGFEKPYFFDVSEAQDISIIPATLTQEYMLVPPPLKDCYLVYLIKRFTSLGSIIIFVPEKGDCETVYMMLQDLQFSVAHLHSFMPQSRRNHAIHLMKSGLVQILVATDVGSRGLDIPAVSLVINYNIPRIIEDYVHRVGRTARAGRKGRSVSLVTQYDVELLLAIEEKTKTTMTELDHDEQEVLALLNKSLTAKQVAILHLDENGFTERLARRKALKQEDRKEKMAEQGITVPERKKKTPTKDTGDQRFQKKKKQHKGVPGEQKEENKKRKMKDNEEASPKKKLKKNP